MIIILSILFYLIEAFMFGYLASKIAKHHSVSLKDTLIYPFIFLIGFVIVVVAYIKYGDFSLIDALPKGVSDAINVVKLSLDNNLIDMLKNSGIDGVMLLISYYMIYALSFFALISLAILLFIASFKNVIRLFIISFRKEINIVFGLNQDGKTFVTNLDKKNRVRTIVVLDSSKMDKYAEERLFLNENKIAYMSKPYSNVEEIFNTLKNVIKSKSKKYNLVTFFLDDNLNQTFALASKQYLDDSNAYGGYFYNQKDIKELNPNKVYVLELETNDNNHYEAKINGATLIDYSAQSGIYVFKTKSENVIVEIAKVDNYSNSKKLIPYVINTNLFNKSSSKKILKLDINNLDDARLMINELAYKEQANIEIIINASNQAKTFINEFCEKYSKSLNNSNKLFLDEKWQEKENVDKCQGLIRTFNKYDLCSYDFICNHNFAKYFPSKLLNKDCTVKDCDINLYVFGFGKVNQSLLKDVLINTTFVKKVKEKEGYKLTPVRMNVKVYDKKSKNDDLETSLGFIKYNKNSFDQNKYLPLIDNYLDKDSFRFNTSIDQFNVIDGVYDEIKNRLYNNKIPQVNYFIISFDSDYANWNLANKFKEHLSSIKNCTNVFFFRTKEKLAIDDEANFYSYGIEKASSKDDKVVLSYDNVVKDKIYDLARSRHFMYINKDVDFEIGENSDSSSKIVSSKATKCSWAQIPYFKKQSNLYAIASTYFKLDLMRLNNLKEEYVTRYLENGTIYSYDKLAKANKSYSCQEVLAFLEHERWNAFEIAHGVLPLRIDMLIDLTNQNKEFTTQVDHMYHLCITTAEGLIKYYNIANNNTIFENGMTFKSDADVIKYDYDLMDYFEKHLDKLDLYK